MNQESRLKAFVLTVSDSASRGERVDTAGPSVGKRLEEMGCEVAGIEVVPDDRAQIAARLRELSDSEEVDLVFTTGGTGMAPRDVTPEATSDVIDRTVPGVAELIRAEGLKHTPRAALSRGMAGTRKRTLFINLPGSPRGAVESVDAVTPILGHAVEVLRGEVSECAREDRTRVGEGASGRVGDEDPKGSSTDYTDCTD